MPVHDQPGFRFTFHELYFAAAPRLEMTMRQILFGDQEFVAAGHEDPTNPGVWKKVLFRKDDLQLGRIQMINWARLPAGNTFAAHYHEDMQEIFIVLTGVDADSGGRGRCRVGAGRRDFNRAARSASDVERWRCGSRLHCHRDRWRPRRRHGVGGVVTAEGRENEFPIVMQS